jgi:glycosyltransferase involved in cell wall biosynthesis
LQYVGDGPEYAALLEASRTLKLAGRVEFLGHISELKALRHLYAHALVSVSPGYVGLSLTQSLSFGVPMIFANNEPHAPEIEAVQIGVNALEFSSDSAEALAACLVKVFKDQSSWLARRPSIANDCAHQYSAEVMADGFLVGAGVTPETLNR